MTKTPLLLIALAAIALLASIPLLFAPDAIWVATVSVAALLAITAVALPNEDIALVEAVTATAVGTVRASGAESDVITIDVENVSGHAFTGRLRRTDGDAGVEALRPGTVLLVTFDPQAREQLSLADDMSAVRSAFDRMLVSKGLATENQLNLIRSGVKTHAVVTGVQTTAVTREDHREVVVDLMVQRAGGGQFPAHETTMIPADALPSVVPGSVVDVYYSDGDESAVAVCVAPNC